MSNSPTPSTSVNRMEGTRDDSDDDMRQDSDSSSSSDNESSSSRSEDESSSDMDESELDRRKTECLDTLDDLERQFNVLREQLYRERCTQVDDKLFEIRSGRAPEYLIPLQQLQEEIKIKTEVASILRDLAVKSALEIFEAEEAAAKQHLESEVQLLKDSMLEELQNEIRRLEEDKNNIDVSSALWGTEDKPRRAGNKPKPVTVTGPYIVYMLSDSDILSDLTVIKKALSASKRKLSVP